MTKTWKPPTLETTLTFHGGFASQRYPVKVVVVETVDYGTVTFVHCEKNAEWILQASCGVSEKASLKRSTLFQELRKKLVDANAEKARAAEPAVAADDAAARDEDDPMSAIRAIETPEKATGKKRKVYTSRRGKNTPQLVRMPAKEPNKYPHSTATHDVLLMPMSTNALYVRADDIPWLLTYLADECGPGGSQGVRMLDDVDDVEGVLTYGREYDEKECHVPGLGMKWDGQSQTVEATAYSGPHEGKIWKLAMENFTEDKWKTVVAFMCQGTGLDGPGEVSKHEYGESFAVATHLQKFRAAWDFVEMSCAKKMDQ